MTEAEKDDQEVVDIEQEGVDGSSRGGDGVAPEAGEPKEANPEDGAKESQPDESPVEQVYESPWVEPLNVPGILCIGIHKKGVLVKSPEALTFIRDLRLVSSGTGMELR